MKLKSTILILTVCTACITFINSCRKNTESNPPLTRLNFNIPAGFPQPIYNFQNNALTQQGFDLGKKLFYDGRLSIDGNFPCASCHQQPAAFSTFEHDLSHGYNNQFTKRNAPALFNLVWQSTYQWDGGINDLEAEPVMHITAPDEMAETMNNVVNKLKADAAYRQMFKAAFGDEDITTQRILKALAQFTGSIVSANAKYDQVKRGEKTFTTTEQAGYVTFQEKCASCHKEPLFTDNSFRNTGLTVNSYLKDYGRMNITHLKEDSLKFKVPTLRNLAFTFPYTHDGRFWTLDEVLNHYTTLLQDSPTLDPLLKNKISLTNQERANLKLFLATLSDSTLVNDKKFAQQ
jgi:cytochrome c peroxidase